MPKFMKTKRVLVPTGIVAALVIAGAAYAYFSSTGSGTGTASVGNSQAVTLHGTPASSLYPGASSTVNFTVDNPAPGTERVGTIHLASVSVDSAHAAAGCSNTDFSMPDVAANQGFPNGNGQAVTATGTLSMANSTSNQDACQGATLTLSLSSN